MPWGDRNELWWMDPKYDWSTSVAAASRNFMQAREMAQEQKQFDALMPVKQAALEVDMLNAATRAQEVTSLTEMRRSALQDDLRSKPLFDEWVLNIQKSGDLNTPIPGGLAPKWHTQAIHTLTELRRLQANSAESIAAKDAASTRKLIDSQMARKTIDLITTFPDEFADLPVETPFSQWDTQAKLRARAGFAKLTEFKRQGNAAPKSNPFVDDLARAEAELASATASVEQLIKDSRTGIVDKEAMAKAKSRAISAKAKVEEWKKKAPSTDDPLNLFRK